MLLSVLRLNPDFNPASWVWISVILIILIALIGQAYYESIGIFKKLEKITFVKNRIGDHQRDFSEKNLWHDVPQRKFSIRVISISSRNKNYRSLLKDNSDLFYKDLLQFSLSLPHSSTPQFIADFKKAVPELMDIHEIDDRTLMLQKSKASSFVDMQESILRFLFIRLHKLDISR